MVTLPNVQIVRRGQTSYFYYVPNRNTSHEGPRIPLGKDPTDPEFWRRYKEARGDDEAGVKPGTFSALIQEYKTSADWDKLSENTKTDYSIYLKRIEAHWGNLLVSGLTTVGIYKLRDKYSHTPAGANHLVRVLRNLLQYGIKRGYGTINPAVSVEPIDTDEKTATPWSETTYRKFLQLAPEHLRRAAFLGRATGQRRSDLVTMGKKDRRDDGLQITIRKLRYRPHFVVLKKNERAEIDRWSCAVVGPWILSPTTGQPMSAKALANAFRYFRDNNPALMDIHGEPINLHGLRAMAVCDRRMDGLTHQEIAAQLCMSLGKVMHYSRHLDTETLARSANVKRERTAHRLKKTGLQD
jgi:integrase